MSHRKLPLQIISLTLVVFCLNACNASPSDVTTGQVKGVLKTNDIGPMEGVSVSLADFEETDDGSKEIEMVYIDGLWQGSVAQTETDSQGIFLLKDVPPGEYELIILSNALQDTEGHYVIVEVVAGQVFNMGTISFVNQGNDKYRSFYKGVPSSIFSPLWIAVLVILAVVLATLVYRFFKTKKASP